MNNKIQIYAINGSPRKNFNTAQLLQAFLEGTKSVSNNLETSLINLYDLNYKGCTECYACKLKNGKSYGQCAYPDEIRDLLKDIAQADVIAFGSPIYFYDITGELRSFLERLFYPFTAFKKNSPRVIAPKAIRTAFIYTMNVTEQEMRYCQYSKNLSATLQWTQHIFRYRPEILYAYNTYQYQDYDRYVADLWDIADKKRWHDTQFPIDCKSAFQLGEKIIKEIF